MCRVVILGIQPMVYSSFFLGGVSITWFGICGYVCIYNTQDHTLNTFTCQNSWWQRRSGWLFQNQDWWKKKRQMSLWGAIWKKKKGKTRRIGALKVREWWKDVIVWKTHRLCLYRSLMPMWTPHLIYLFILVKRCPFWQYDMLLNTGIPH